MWELICHHTYKLPGIPVDLSDYDSSGRPEKLNDDDFAGDGVTPGSGTVRFPRSGSRIRVPSSNAWKPLIGLSVEIIARFTPEVHPGPGGDIVRERTLVAGHGSFSFQFFAQKMSAIFHGDSIGVNSVDHSVDGLVHTVPENQWVNLRLLHDGISKVQFFIDGQLVVQRTDLQAVVGPVRHLGVSIGNEADRDDRFLDHCEIDEVKVWRLDPRKVGRTFLSRPLDGATVYCWEELFRRINEAFAKDPECQPFLGNEIANLIQQLRRGIAAQGPEALAIYADFCDTYERLWKAGQLDSPEMADLFSGFCAWLQEIGLSPDSGPLHKLLSSSCLSEVLGDPGLLDCDPQAAALIHLIAHACSDR